MERLQSKLTSLTTSLQTAETENKNLSAKLAASRAAANASQTTDGTNGRMMIPNSAIKRNGHGNGHGPNGTANAAAAAEVTRIAQVKENLYSDLTGLILPNIKRTEEGDTVVDCIQTGRNGSMYPFHLFIYPRRYNILKPTPVKIWKLMRLINNTLGLHFKLTLLDSSNTTLTTTSTTKKAGAGAGPSISYEDQEFLFTPLLDPHRDRALMELLPEYLQEEISFTRGQAEKFYERVVKCLTQKLVDEGGERDGMDGDDGEGEGEEGESRIEA